MPIKDLNLWGAPNVPMGHLKSPRGASIHLHVDIWGIHRTYTYKKCMETKCRGFLLQGCGGYSLAMGRTVALAGPSTTTTHCLLALSKLEGACIAVQGHHHKGRGIGYP